MPDIMVVLACLSQCVEPTTLGQLGRVIEAMLSISGRVTMRGLSRWSGKGGSYRSIQRLFNTTLSWCQLNWLLMRHHLLDADDVVLMSGDHVVVTKSGKATYGLDRFFSSLYGKMVPGLCFLSLSLLSVKRRSSYPVVTEQVDKPLEASVPAPPKKQKGDGAPKAARIAIVTRWSSAHRCVLFNNTSRGCWRKLAMPSRSSILSLTVSWAITKPCKW